MENSRIKSRIYKPISLDVEEVEKKVLDAAYTVHSALGPGLLKSVYEACLCMKLS